MPRPPDWHGGDKCVLATVVQVHDDLEATDAGLMYSCFRSAQK
jgi:hypothetical protein